MKKRNENKSKQKGGDVMLQGNGKTVVLELAQDTDDIISKVGRPTKPKNEKVLKNGLLPRQQEWLRVEAPLMHMSADQYKRVIIDWWIDSVEASRNPLVATSRDDRNFEKLITKKTKKTKVRQVKQK